MSERAALRVQLEAEQARRKGLERAAAQRAAAQRATAQRIAPQRAVEHAGADRIGEAVEGSSDVRAGQSAGIRG